MATKVSKNARTSKPKEVIKPQKIKKVKEQIYIELTAKIYLEIKQSGDMSVYQGKEILGVVRKYGKDYLLIKNT